jgi:flagellar biosynthetic protein FliR
MVSAMLDTFQTLPVGDAFVAPAAVDLVRDLVHESLILAVQVAAPMLATMSLLSLSMGFLGHTVPQVNLLVVGFPVRAVTSMLILAVTFSGAGKVVVDTVPDAIDRLRIALTNLP